MSGSATATGRQVGFSLDLGKCVGCGACVVACRIENGVPADLEWRRVLTFNQARYDGGPTYHLSLACHHCQAPPCRNACPTGALEKRSDGVVLLHAELCVGCRYCEMACPFEAPAYDSRSGVMTKCHLCHHRLEQGLGPACVEACPTGALGFVQELAGGPGPEIPGFTDPAGAEPAIRFTLPVGGLREERMERLGRLLAEEEDPHGEA